jgi:hypothetical protein
VTRGVTVRQHGPYSASQKPTAPWALFGAAGAVAWRAKRADDGRNGQQKRCRDFLTAPPVVQQHQSVRPPRQARRRRAIARQRDQMPTILRVEKAAANHAPSESSDPQKARISPDSSMSQGISACLAYSESRFAGYVEGLAGGSALRACRRQEGCRRGARVLGRAETDNTRVATPEIGDGLADEFGAADAGAKFLRTVKTGIASLRDGFSRMLPFCRARHDFNNLAGKQLWPCGMAEALRKHPTSDRPTPR